MHGIYGEVASWVNAYKYVHIYNIYIISNFYENCNVKLSFNILQSLRYSGLPVHACKLSHFRLYLLPFCKSHHNEHAQNE